MAAVSADGDGRGPGGGEALSRAERRTLGVLGFLYLRSGLMDKAARAFEALLADRADDASARRGLAAVLVARGDGAGALEMLRGDLSGPLSSREAALLLLKAKALWLEGRKEEAARATEEFGRLSGAAG